MAKYDIVVVGAGNAGMSAALQCQLAGKRTLLIEQHNLPGGAATSFCRGRFEIEPSLHEICDYGPSDNPGDVRTMMDAYGVKLDWMEIPDCYRVVSVYRDGGVMDVTMPSGVEAYIDAMEKYVPGSREKMEKLFELFQEVLDGIAYITASKGHTDSKVLQEKYPNMLRTGAYSTQKVFDALKLPERCQDILSIYWSYLGVDMEHLAFIHYAAMVHKYVSRGAYMPKHTSHQFSTAMIERFRELGGDVWFNCRAEEFLFNGDRLCGVRTNMGKIDCDYVLANINPDIIYGRMMPKELVPEREKKLSAARGKRFGARMYTAYFCCDKSAEKLGIKDYSIFLPGTSDSAKEYRNIMNGMATNDYSIFLCYNVTNPEFSPEGTCVCSFTTFGSPVDWNDLKQENYFRFKNDGAKKMLAVLKEKTGIDLTGHIEEMAVASPWTFARYLGTPEGSVYGYETTDWDGMMARMMMLSTDYPIKGLRPIGAAGPRGDGYSAALICGQLMALNALKDLREEGGKA
ncbi:MAG: NAD(P)/FAD-dependent oxidoreductase [Eubacteriales bacterium]|nr:NAD(P)/FAD-dependent oxidoreductase [Eubacteriales bacterium]